MIPIIVSRVGIYASTQAAPQVQDNRVDEAGDNRISEQGDNRVSEGS